jgi:hypothetical protein
MVALVPPQRVNLPLASTAGMAAGAAVALGFFVLPSGLLDSLVDATHLASILPAAEPPLGFTARSVLALGFGTFAGGITWLALGMAKANGMISFGKAKAQPAEPEATERSMLILRRADAHPDAPPRPPLIASRDLGTPFLEVQAPAPAPKTPVVEVLAKPEPAVVAKPVIAPSMPAAIPADLDTPLAVYAPSDWCPAPAPEPAPAPRAPALAEGERIEAFELKPVAGPAQRPGEHPASIQTLLDRLEHGIAQRPAAEPRRTGSLQDTLAELRRVAAAHR